MSIRLAAHKKHPLSVTHAACRLLLWPAYMQGVSAGRLEFLEFLEFGAGVFGVWPH